MMDWQIRPTHSDTLTQNPWLSNVLILFKEYHAIFQLTKTIIHQTVLYQEIIIVIVDKMTAWQVSEMNGNLTCETYSLFLSFVEIWDLFLIGDWWIYWACTHTGWINLLNHDSNSLTRMFYNDFIPPKLTL